MKQSSIYFFRRKDYHIKIKAIRIKHFFTWAYMLGNQIECSIRSSHMASPTTHGGTFLSLLISKAWALWVKTQASVSRSRRWRRLLASLLWVSSWRVGFGSCVWHLLRRWSTDVGAAAPDGGCASRRWPRDPWWVAASWGGAAAWVALATFLCR